MPSISYEDLGAISGVTQTPRTPGSVRSRDRNDRQRLAFQCDPAKPFTGIIHVEASVGDPTAPEDNRVWFDIAQMEINNEGGSWSYEPEGEFSSLRVVCRDGNYWSSVTSSLSSPAIAQVLAPHTFTIDGITVTVNAGDDATTVANTINTTPGISAANIVADVVTNTTVTNTLRIYKTDGSTLVLADTGNTPLADMGIAEGSYNAGTITKIRMLR